MGLDQTLLDALERSYLIRREFNTVGGYSYEISHDTLVAPIQQAKALRQAEEERAAANRRIRRLVGIVAVVGMLLVGAGLLTAYAFRQQAEAKRAQTMAKTAQREALRQKAEAIAEREKADSLRSVAEANLRTAARAILETNTEKLREAERVLSERKRGLRDYEAKFSGLPARVNAKRQAVRKAERDRAFYRAKVDSLTKVVQSFENHAVPQ